MIYHYYYPVKAFVCYKADIIKNKPVLVDKREIKQYSLIQSNEKNCASRRDYWLTLLSPYVNGEIMNRV